MNIVSQSVEVSSHLLVPAKKISIKVLSLSWMLPITCIYDALSGAEELHTHIYNYYYVPVLLMIILGKPMWTI